MLNFFNTEMKNKYTSDEIISYFFNNKLRTGLMVISNIVHFLNLIQIIQ